MYCAGYYTVEAVFVMMISLWVLMAMCYTGLYVHDRLLLESGINGQTVKWIYEGQNRQEEWEKEIKKELQDKMFLFRISSVEAVKKTKSVTVKMYGTIPISQKLLSRVFNKSKDGILWQTQRENIWGAESCWNAEMIKGKDKAGEGEK